MQPPSVLRSLCAPTHRKSLVFIPAFLLVLGGNIASAQPPMAPIAFNDSAVTQTGQYVDVTVLANDMCMVAPASPGTVTAVTQPAHGTAVVNSTTGKIRYTPTAGYSGSDSFTYDFEDTAGNWSNVAVVNVSVTFVNAAPVIQNFVMTFDTLHTYTFTGLVVDDQSPSGLTIVFGGILAGLTTTVGQNGTFSFVRALYPDSATFATAQVTDAYGGVSQLVWQFLTP